jgi:hypothetical protein
LAPQSETLRLTTVFWVGVMMRNVTAAILAAFAGMFLLPGAQAQTVPSGLHRAEAQPTATEMSAQHRVRPLTRLRVYPRYLLEPDGVYPRYYPGRNAVRDCTATYQAEYRPSGTVIVPHMSCYWRRG